MMNNLCSITKMACTAIEFLPKLDARDCNFNVLNKNAQYLHILTHEIFSIASQIGSIIGPQLIYIRKYWHSAPYMGVVITM